MSTDIQPQLMNQPVRAYPLRNVNEPPMFVIGERAGQKALPSGQGGAGGGGPPGMISIGNMSMSQQQAMLAQQNSQMESLERRRERAMRERSASNAGVSKTALFTNVLLLTRKIGCIIPPPHFVAPCHCPIIPMMFAALYLAETASAGTTAGPDG